MFDIYIHASAVQKAEEYFSVLAASKLEGLGLLVGSNFEYEDANYLQIVDFITGETNSSAVSVSFSKHAFEKLAGDLKERDEIVVGWCHSHPTYGCFLSATDVNAQRSFFNEDFHVAGVFDPMRKEDFGSVNAMAKRFYRLTDKGYREVSFAVVKDVK